ncbi:MAG: hypothetical protein ABIK93_06790 [candidate division WOR-3 bacterium]
MKDIEKFINLINTSSPQNPYSVSEWEKFLDNNLPNWKSIVKDLSNWQLIDEVKPIKGFHDFLEALVNNVGVELANHWFNSDIEEHRKVSREWLKEKMMTNTPTYRDEEWNKLSDDAKEYVIHYCFDIFPGEPFHTFTAEFIIRHLSYPHVDYPIFPKTGYIPSQQVLYLRSVIKKAGDGRFLKVVDNMIKERKEALGKFLSPSPISRFVFIPTRDEKELIARVMDKFRKRGYSSSPLPEIYLSFEPPPVFVAYPELEDELKEIKEEQIENPRIPRNRERGRPDTISIEELLGCYLPDYKIIIIYQKGLKWASKRYNFNEELLRGMVLIHEIGHWITHLLPKPNTPFWPTELYKLSSEEVTEGWAQLITWWVVNEVGGEIEKCFENLNKNQPRPYRVYEEFKSEPINSVIDSLEMLRQLHWPAGITDWKRLIKRA